jgi:hypothetical protein
MGLNREKVKVFGGVSLIVLDRVNHHIALRLFALNSELAKFLKQRKKSSGLQWL